MRISNVSIELNEVAFVKKGWECALTFGVGEAETIFCRQRQRNRQTPAPLMWELRDHHHVFVVGVVADSKVRKGIFTFDFQTHLLQFFNVINTQRPSFI